MATTITPATLTVKTTETINIGGIVHEFTSSFQKTGVTHISQRQMNIGTGSFTEIVNFSSSVSPGTFIDDDVRYARITNLDNANQVVMKLNHKASGQTFYRTIGRDSTESFYSLKMNVNTTNAAMSGAVSDTTSVFEVSMSAVGSGYSSPPTVSFSGGGGSAAAGTAVLDGNTVKSVTITNPGTGYTSTPTVGFSGGGGSGAAAKATLVADALWTPSDFYNFDSISAQASGSACDITVFIATI